jgi:hypothetical protein
MDMWRGSRQASGIKSEGDVAEVWQGGRQVGLLFRWKVNGFDGRWDGSAVKHRFDAGFDQGEVEFRFQLEGLPFELRGFGHVRGQISDGATHHEPVDLKGTRLWVETGIPVSSESN